MDIVPLALAHDSSLWIQSKYFYSLCSLTTFLELLNSPHPALNRIEMVWNGNHGFNIQSQQNKQKQKSYISAGKTSQFVTCALGKNSKLNDTAH